MAPEPSRCTTPARLRGRSSRGSGGRRIPRPLDKSYVLPLSPYIKPLRLVPAEQHRAGQFEPEMAHLVSKRQTPLMLAAQEVGPDAHMAVLALLGTGARTSINDCDATGLTALMFAARCGSNLVVQQLIEAGADLETLCHGGESAWTKAARGGHRPAALLLESAGARHGRDIGDKDERSSPAAFSMPSASGCDATRFTSQFRNRMPVYLPGLVAGWPACQSWSADRARLAMRLGGSTTRVPLLRPADGGRLIAAEARAPTDGATVSVSSCLSQTLDASTAHASGPPMMSKLPLTAEVLADLGSVPGSIFGAPAVAVAGETRLWISSRGSVTPLHFDHCHSVICQIVGRKKLTCFAPCDSACLYPFSLADGNVRTSRVDLWAWRFGSAEARGQERHKHPNVASAMPLEQVLCPGDVAYIPPGWWHHVETLEEGSISVLLPFDLNGAEQRSMDRPWTRPGWGGRWGEAS